MSIMVSIPFSSSFFGKRKPTDLQLTSGSSGSSLGCGTSSTRLNFPFPYLMGLLLVETDDQDNRFVDPMILLGASDSVLAVDGRVSGFMARGARNGSNCGAFCGTTVRSDPLVPGREPSCSGGGLFGSSLVGGGCGESSVGP